jgi:hypothetical protein
MSSATRGLLLVAFAAQAIAGCVDETSPPAGVRATEQPLQEHGVYYLAATGTAENPAFTFADQDKAVIGNGRSSRNPQLTEIQWRGNSWENTGDGFRKNGVAVGPDGASAAELDTILTVFERSLDQAFPPDPGSLNDQVQANVCIVGTACRRPDFRCSGSCTGFVCSSKIIGQWGVCDPPR